MGVAPFCAARCDRNEHCKHKSICHRSSFPGLIPLIVHPGGGDLGLAGGVIPVLVHFHFSSSSVNGKNWMLS